MQALNLCVRFCKSGSVRATLNCQQTSHKTLYLGNEVWLYLCTY